MTIHNADSTAHKQQIGRPFLPGKSGNPLGRPKCSRNKLAEDFLRALADDFERDGISAIAQVRLNSPKDYLKVIASLMPKGVELDVTLDASPELRMELAKFVNDYRLVKEAMSRIGVANDIIEAVVIDGD